MAIFANTDAVVTINTVDLSDHLVSVDWNESTDVVETVAMGDTLVTVKPTFGRGSISLELQQDFATSSTYATLVAAKGTSIAVTYKHTSATTSATNPEMQTNAVVTEVPVASGGIGSIMTLTMTWPFDGTTITRAVA